MTNKITKEEFDSLYDPDIKHREFLRIQGKIDNRLCDIIATIMPKRPPNSWFDYGNCDTRGEQSHGYFDEVRYKEEIPVHLNGFDFPEETGLYESFPTRWLWEDIDCDGIPKKKPKVKRAFKKTTAKKAKPKKKSQTKAKKKKD